MEISIKLVFLRKKEIFQVIPQQSEKTILADLSRGSEAFL